MEKYKEHRKIALQIVDKLLSGDEWWIEKIMARRHTSVTVLMFHVKYGVNGMW